TIAIYLVVVLDKWLEFLAGITVKHPSTKTCVISIASYSVLDLFNHKLKQPIHLNKTEEALKEELNVAVPQLFSTTPRPQEVVEKKPKPGPTSCLPLSPFSPKKILNLN
ncbi:14967_t:CDS:2, partial [Racocetra persica]